MCDNFNGYLLIQNDSLLSSMPKPRHVLLTVTFTIQMSVAFLFSSLGLDKLTTETIAFI
jgi:hypothetical protein